MAIIARTLSGSTKIEPDDTDMVLADHLEDKGWGYLAGILRGNPASEWLLEVFRNGPTTQALVVGQDYSFQADSLNIPSMVLSSMRWDLPTYEVTSAEYTSILRQPTGAIRLRAEFVATQHSAHPPHRR